MEDENNIFQDANQDAGGQEAAVAVADQNRNVPAGNQNNVPAGNANAVQQQGPHVAGAGAIGGQGIPPPPIQNPAGAIPNPVMNFRIICSPWDGDIDLSTKDGKSLWTKGTYPLETPFTGTGKDVGRFLTEVSIRVRTCKWEGIITFGARNLITQHGQISKTEVEAAKALREAVVPTTMAQARPLINARMMFHFVYGSLEDGPLLLKMVLLNTFIATKASLFTIKEDFYGLTLKQFKYNVVTLHTEIRSMIVELTASGVTMDETDVAFDNAWKKDRSLSSSTTLKKDNKEYKWCTGPGHGGIGMWVMHVPGSCTEMRAGTGSNNDHNSGNDGTVNRAALTATLQAKGLSDDEVQSKVEAIIAVMDN